MGYYHVTLSKAKNGRMVVFMRTLALFVCVICSSLFPFTLAASVAITGVDQRPWMIRDGGSLKSETELTVDNGEGPAREAWVKISVPGKPDYLESLGSLPAGTSKRVVHVLELNNDGDKVTFALYDNGSGSGAPLSVHIVAQQKIRHWRLYVGHNSHFDIGYRDYQ